MKKKDLIKDHEEIRILLDVGDESELGNSGKEGAFVDQSGKKELEEQFQRLLDIVLNVYVNSWYPWLSPRDRKFLPALHLYISTLLRAVIQDLSSEAVLELILYKLPVVLRRHVEYSRLARKDALSRSNKDMHALEGERRQAAAAYQRMCPHPGLVRAAPSSTETKQTQAQRNQRTQENDQPRTPDRSQSFASDQAKSPSDAWVLLQPEPGLDDNLAEAMASSIVLDPDPHFRNGSIDPGSSRSRGRRATSSVPSADEAPDYGLSVYHLSDVVDGILAKYLPPTDYESDLERTLVTDILASAVIANVLQKITSPFFFWRIGIALLPPVDENSEKPPNSIDGLLYRGVNVIVNSLPKALHWLITGIPLAVIFLLNWALGDVSKSVENETLTEAQKPSPSKLWLDLAGEVLQVKSSHIKAEVWTFVEAVRLLAAKTIDSRITCVIQEKVCSTHMLAAIMEKLIDILYPNGEPAPTIPDPTPEEEMMLRQEFENRVFAKIPNSLRYTLLHVRSEEQMHGLQRITDLLDNQIINLNLLMEVMDLVHWPS